MIKICAGLGNPGEAYKTTRHNLGFQLVDQIAQRFNALWSYKAQYQANYTLIRLNNHSIHLIKPLTYMNRSGPSIASLAHFFKIPENEILIIHDELDLLPGTIRLKFGGSAGGHNGLKSIQTSLNSLEFWRLRIGIGHPRDLEIVANNKPFANVSDFVLSTPNTIENIKIAQAFDKSIDVIDEILVGNCTQAMQLLNQKII